MTIIQGDPKITQAEKVNAWRKLKNEQKRGGPSSRLWLLTFVLHNNQQRYWFHESTVFFQGIEKKCLSDVLQNKELLSWNITFILCPIQLLKLCSGKNTYVM